MGTQNRRHFRFYSFILMMSLLILEMVIWILSIESILPNSWSSIIAAIFAFTSIAIALCNWLWPLNSSRDNPDNRGILIIDAKEELRGRNVELRHGFIDSSLVQSLPVDFASNIVRQIINGKTSFVATFPSLVAGPYTACVMGNSQMFYAQVTIIPGNTSRIDWQ